MTSRSTVPSAYAGSPARPESSAWRPTGEPGRPRLSSAPPAHGRGRSCRGIPGRTPSPAPRLTARSIAGPMSTPPAVASSSSVAPTPEPRSRPTSAGRPMSCGAPSVPRAISRMTSMVARCSGWPRPASKVRGSRSRPSATSSSSRPSEKPGTPACSPQRRCSNGSSPPGSCWPTAPNAPSTPSYGAPASGPRSRILRTLRSPAGAGESSWTDPAYPVCQGSICSATAIGAGPHRPR